MATPRPLNSSLAAPDSCRLTVRPYREPDEAEVVELWRSVFPDNPSWNVPLSDIRRKRLVQPELFLVGECGAKVVATAMAGFDGHRGWLHLVAVLPEFRRRGFGRALIAEAERRLAELGCPKVNLQVRASNREVVTFYEAMGYVVEDRVSMGKRLTEKHRNWDDASLVTAFEDASYPLEEWTHRAHVRIAYLYLVRFDLNEAIARMRSGLQRYIAAHDVGDGPEKGYHETITQAFMRLIQTAVSLYSPYTDSQDFCRRHPELLEKRALLLFYSRDRILSPEAKRYFVEPDLAPLPAVRAG